MYPISLRRRLQLLSGIVLSFLLIACAGTPETGQQPVQSPNDDRQYRLLTLDNQLQVLLISDPSTPKAAASLDVQVGSGDNPEGWGGLAHFLEHMLFLGTDKYPDAAEYEEFVTEHGGHRNAYTASEHTNYFFDVDAPHLPEALDRFAQFFISPRFDAQYVDREKNAVQAEYQMGLKSDARRGLDVMREVVNPEHPYSQFAVGSLESLADRPDMSARDALLAFYDKYYSANLMRLVVLGSESLDELESLVTPMFSQVENKSQQQVDIPVPLFTDEALPAFVQVMPQATRRQLQVQFPMGDYRQDYDVKPMSYLGNLVGHEGEGSLLSQLKAEGLAESLAAGAGWGWRGGSLFGVTIVLTEQGVAEQERVLQLLFAYLDMLREKGPKEWIYEEQAQVAGLAFRFQEKASPMSYVSALSSGMHYYASKDVLQGPYVMRNFQAEMLSDMMQYLVADNALVILDDMSVQTDRVSEYYQVPYSVEQVGDDQLAAWQGEVAPGLLALPAPNEFIAEDVSLVKLERDNPEHPTLVLEQPRKRIWFVQDEEFRLPKSATYINFRSPEVGRSVEQSATAVLYTALLKDRVNEYTYPAALAGLNFHFYKHAQGISLRTSGYSDKQFVLLSELLATIVESEIDEQRFQNIRKDMIRALENSVAKRPSSQVIDDLRESVLWGDWGEQAVIEVLRNLQLEDVNSFARRFWDSADAEALVYGNYSPDAVPELAKLLDGVLPDSEPQDLIPVKVVKFAAGDSALYPVEIPHDDSVLAWYLQGAGNTWEDRAATALTAQIMKSGFFQQLRTEQQLGYITSAFAWSPMDVPGLVMLIQSPVADADALARAMDEFLQQVESGVTQEQFLRHRAALVNEITSPDKNMWERAEFYWQSIAKKQYEFEGRENFAAAVEALSLEQWAAYFRQVFIEQPRSLQVVAPGRWAKLPAGKQVKYSSADEIKASHGYYEVE
jgi:insulysin